MDGWWDKIICLCISGHFIQSPGKMLFMQVDPTLLHAMGLGFSNMHCPCRSGHSCNSQEKHYIITPYLNPLVGWLERLPFHFNPGKIIVLQLDGFLLISTLLVWNWQTCFFSVQICTFHAIPSKGLCKAGKQKSLQSPIQRGFHKAPSKAPIQIRLYKASRSLQRTHINTLKRENLMKSLGALQSSQGKPLYR